MSFVFAKKSTPETHFIEDAHEKTVEWASSLAVSQIVYVLSSLPTPQGVIKEINSLSYDFLWDGKSDKIKRT